MDVWIYTEDRHYLNQLKPMCRIRTVFVYNLPPEPAADPGICGLWA